MPGWTVSKVSESLLDGIALGKNPKAIASQLVKDFGGSLTDVLRMTRTVQLWSYREATRANYIANDDVVTGWIWSSAKDNRTCPACIVMDGTFHKNDEQLNDHHNGRCAMVPVTILNPNPERETGVQWLNMQPKAVQQEILGVKRWKAWKDGLIKLEDIPHNVDNDVYGPMRVPKPLKDLLNDG
jgi:SPP1 gp7 family putative phage head morphogenesis protein